MLHWEVQISNHSEHMQGDLLPFNHKYLEFDGNHLLRNEALELISPETFAGLWQSLSFLHTLWLLLLYLIFMISLMKGYTNNYVYSYKILLSVDRCLLAVIVSTCIKIDWTLW